MERSMKESRPTATSRDLRGVAPQILAVVAVGLVFAWLAHNTIMNLATRHIASGFGFLADPAGFAISEGLLHYEPGDSYALAFAAGVANTLRAAIPAVILASLIGFGAGIAQLSSNALLRSVARSYVDIVRNVPLLVQVLVWYFAITQRLPQGD